MKPQQPHQTRPLGLPHDDPENSERVFWRAPALQNTTKIPREDAQRGEHRLEFGRVKEKRGRHDMSPSPPLHQLRSPTFRPPLSVAPQRFSRLFFSTVSGGFTLHCPDRLLLNRPPPAALCTFPVHITRARCGHRIHLLQLTRFE